MKLTKEQFSEVLDFLSGYGGFTDLGDDEMKEELWDDYQKDL